MGDFPFLLYICIHLMGSKTIDISEWIKVGEVNPALATLKNKQTKSQDPNQPTNRNAQSKPTQTPVVLLNNVLEEVMKSPPLKLGP